MAAQSRRIGLSVLVALSLACWAGSNGATAQNAGGAPVLSQTNFRSPPLSAKPFYRWWLPLAAVDDDELRREIDQMAQGGAGGVEIAAMPVPGDAGSSAAFLESQGFGTARWSSVLEVALDHAREADLAVDLMVGPMWPTVTPGVSALNDPAAQQQLVAGYSQIAAGAEWSGPPPRPARPGPSVSTQLCEAARKGQAEVSVRSTQGLATGDVIAIGADQDLRISRVSAGAGGECGALELSRSLGADAPAGGEVLAKAAERLIAVLAVRCATAECPATGRRRMLDAASVQDLTAAMANGTLDWTAPAEGPSWWVVALYQRADGQKLDGLTATGSNYVVDHLARAGAEAVLDYYDQSILTPRLLELIGQGDSALFEDSFEPSEGLKWTHDFVQAFQRLRGYDLTPYLPLLADAGVGARTGVFEMPEIGERVREDYRQTFSDLYAENHMRPYVEWAHARGLTTRLQVEGGPLEVADLASIPDIPEGENRNFLNDPELWKVIGIGAQMRADEALVSTECCPVSGGVWATTAGGPPFTVAQGTGSPFGGPGNNANLNWIYKAYMGGANHLVWHGFPYLTTPQGSGPRSRWPGNSFDGNTSFSEAFGPSMPQWADYRSVNDHLGRLQLILRQGRPRYDVAVFWHDFGVEGLAPNVTAFTGYPGLSDMIESASPLAAAGYTYQYVSPSYLTEAAVTETRDGVWLPDGLGFKAIVLNDQDVMPLVSLRNVRRLVQDQGVPLVVVGDLPARVPGRAGQADDAELVRVGAELRAMASMPSSRIRFVGHDRDVPGALRDLDVPSAVAFDPASSGDLITVRRHAPGLDYYAVFNQGLVAQRQQIRLAGTGAPYELDTWSGEVRPIGVYEAAEGVVSFDIDVGANDIRTYVIGRPDGVRASAAGHALSSEGRIVADRDRLRLRVDRDGGFSTRLASGRTIRTDVSGVSPAMPLTTWTLDLESWTPDATGLPGLEHTERTRLPAREVSAGPDGLLPGWAAMGHPDKAGLGVYSARFTLPASWSSRDGASLNLGRVVDTFRVSVNGRDLGPLNLQDTRSIDLGRHLKAGENLIEVRVATPLRNAVETATGEGASLLVETGLMGPVVLSPYRDTDLPRR